MKILRRKKLLLLGLCFGGLLSFLFFYGKEQREASFLILATTTSVMDSGLLDYLLPVFKEETGIEVRVVAVGTGKALQMGRDGQADALLVHATKDEELFVKEGHSLKRYDLMYNDFVLLGPKAGPYNEQMRNLADLPKIFDLIEQEGLKFVSRGDDSGTHKKELTLWSDGPPAGDAYISAGKGMGEVLQMASELEAYTLSDRATFLAMSKALDLEIIYENSKLLRNQYGVMAVNPNKNKLIHAENANRFIQWILSPRTQKRIASYGVETYGQSLFTPNAQ